MNGRPTEWYLARDGQQYGPIADRELRRLDDTRELRSSDLLWQEGWSEWVPAASALQSPALQAAAPMALSPRWAEDLGRQTPRRARRPANRSLRGERFKLLRFVSSVLNFLFVALGFGLSTALVGTLWPSGISSALQKGLAQEVFRLAAEAPPTRVAVDAELQRYPMWQTLKAEFAPRYDELLTDLVRRRAAGENETTITRALEQSIDDLRHENTESALAADAETLQAIVQSYIDTLTALRAVGSEHCALFVNRGKPADGRAIDPTEIKMILQAHMTAIFRAAAKGRRMPVRSSKASEGDFRLLLEQLRAKGWTKNDFQVFLDTQRLKASGSSHICNLGQDWMAAHLAIRDPAARERLLVQTLRALLLG